MNWKKLVLLFYDIIKIDEFDFDNLLLDEKSYENILIYNSSYKTLIGAKLLRISFDKVDGFNRAYYGTWYLISFGSEKYDAIYDRIRYLISLESGIPNNIFHNYARNKIDSYNYSSLEKTLTLHGVIILIKSVFKVDRKYNAKI